MSKSTAPRVAISIAFLLLSCLVASVGVSSKVVLARDNRRLGAYYYIWYGLNASIYGKTNWENITETPYLGQANDSSSDPAAADQHILWAKMNRIDFFAVSWLGISDWYDHLAINDNLQLGFLKAKQLGDFSFCLLYESKIVFESTQNKTGLSGPNLTDYFKTVFLNDTDYAVQNYFNHPSYLRIAGKPVLFLYDLPDLCQSLSSSEAHGMLADLRKRLANNIYLVAEVGHGPHPMALGFNLSDFMDVLDAATCYMFSSPSRQWDGILADASRYYPEWHNNMTEFGKQFIPNAYPGYNATKEGVNVTLPVNASGFNDFLQTAWNNIDDNGIVMITSWNEWKESTSIEPSLEFGHQLLDVLSLVPEFPSTPFLIATLFVMLPIMFYRRLRGRPHTRQLTLTHLQQNGNDEK